MKRLKVDWSMLDDAFEDASLEHSKYLDLQTGEVIFVTEEERACLNDIRELADDESAEDLSTALTKSDLGDQPEWMQKAVQRAAEIEADTTGRYVNIPHADSREGYRDMEKFITTVTDERLQELLDVAVQGRGAFRRFKDVLAQYSAELEDYFKFKQQRLRKRITDWLNSLDIEATPED